MAAPTGKLKHAYQTISNMESIIEKQKAQLKKVIATQEKHYGNGMGLHLAMIDLVKELKPMIVYVVLAPTISGDGWFLYSIHTTERKAQDVINEQCSRFDYGKLRIDKREVK